MSKIFNRINDLTFNKYLFLLIIIVYLPIFIFGYFIQDDIGIINSLPNKSFFDAANYICFVNNNRPFSCIYHAAITRLPSVFQFYFFLALSFYILFILNIIKIFDFIIDSIYLKKLYAIFLIFPFFSYTTLYSPVMQSMGVFSLLLWSISLFFLKKFIKDNFKINLFLSYFFLLLMFLLYESPLPLLAVSIFFPLYFNNKIKLFYFNIFIIFLIVIFVVSIQKFLIPEIYDIDLSRIKLNFYDYKKIIFILSVNLVLTLNIFFYSIEIFLRIVVDLFGDLNYLLLTQSFVILIIFHNIIYKEKSHKKYKNNKFLIVSSLIFILLIFLNALMHALADTGLDFIKYNNRALVSLSFIFAFFCIIICKFVSFNKNLLFTTVFTFLFSIFVVNFFYFQSNLIAERLHATQFNKKFQNFSLDKKLKSVDYILTTKPIFIKDLLSYNTLDYFNVLNSNKNILEGSKPTIYLTEQKFCNKSYFNEYLKEPFLTNYNINLFVFNKYPNDLVESYKNISFVNFEKLLNSHIYCEYQISKKETYLKKNVYIDNRYKGFFLNFLTEIYYKL
jgi:hypothetical protein